MTKWKRAIPNGTRDTLFNECSLKGDIEQSFRNVFRLRGYKEIQTPTVEFYDVFSFNGKPIDDEKMFKFFDYKGRTLVLRPDMTIPIGRVIGTASVELPLKLTYSGDIFRANESLKGKYNELSQTGIEIIGISSLRAEIECIISAIVALEKVGMTDFIIEIGQVEIYKLLIQQLQPTEEEELIFRSYIENKSYSGISRFLQEKSFHSTTENVLLLKNLPKLFGGLEVVEQAEQMTNSLPIREALHNIRYIYETIERLGYGHYLTIDLGMIQNIHYYTGVIFRGYTRDVGEEILSGGRYDKLMEQFGEKKPAIGMALQVDQIVRVLKEKDDSNVMTEPTILLHFDVANIRKGEEVRTTYLSDGIAVECSLYDEIGETLAYAEAHHISTVCHIISTGQELYAWDGKWTMKE